MTKHNRRPRYQSEEERHQNDSYRYKKNMLRTKDPKHAKEHKSKHDELTEYEEYEEYEEAV